MISAFASIISLQEGSSAANIDMTTVATCQTESQKLYPVTQEQRQQFEAWVAQKLAAIGSDENATWLRERVKEQRGQVIGISGCLLIFPTFTLDRIVTLEEVDQTIEERIGKSAEDLKRMTAAYENGPYRLQDSHAQRAFVPWQYVAPLIYARQVMITLGIETVHLVQSSNLSGLLRDTKYFAPS